MGENMSYVDLAVSIGVFLFFMALVIGLSIQYFVKVPVGISIEEYREAAINMFERFFSTSGTPADWEDTDNVPSELGLTKSIYKIPITIEEPGTATRTDEPVIVNLVFDEDCSNISWNNTVRVYDSNLNEHEYELVNPVVCSSQFLNESYIRFKVNISQSEEKSFLVFYSEDNGIPGANYTVSYSTSSWVPSSGDSCSEATTSWSLYGGSSASPETNSTVKMRGAASVQINDTFDSKKLGLKYEPGSAITSVSNGWYIDSWIYVDDLSSVASVNVSISENGDTIITSISSSSMSSGLWYHFEKNLSSSEWEDWSTFNASNGIDNITFYMVNSTADITRQLKVDEVHFELRPLVVKSFPEEIEGVIAMKKLNALNNLTYDQLRDVTGEDYKFRIEIVES